MHRRLKKEAEQNQKVNKGKQNNYYVYICVCRCAPKSQQIYVYINTNNQLSFFFCLVCLHVISSSIYLTNSLFKRLLVTNEDTD